MYARGMSTRDIQGHLEEQYGVEVSPALISQVTDAVMEQVRACRTNPILPQAQETKAHLSAITIYFWNKANFAFVGQ
jgi:hypothetical protein